MKRTWVQDAKRLEAEMLVIEKNGDATLIAHQPKGSRYVIGDSRSGNPNESGIYFEDPTG